MPTLRELLQPLGGVRFVQPTEREDRLSSTSFEATSIDAAVVEGSDFQVKDVPSLDHSEFSHFLDGAQRSWQAFYRALSPIYLAHTSAAISERIERDLLPPTDDTYLGSLEAYVPDDPELCQALRTKLPVVTIKVGETQPGGYEELVLKAISDRRDSLEQALAQKFGSGKLLIDGGIGKALRLQGEQAFVVGLVKSHRKQYFKSAKRTEMILQMKTGQRSSVFVRAADALQGESVFSFYLRLHDGEGVNPLFGIVRIEIPAGDEHLGRVDEIAGWILHERAPLSLPDPRYDRLLYPIRLVEQYLKSRQPSTAAVLGLIG